MILKMILVKFKTKIPMKKYLVLALASLFAFASCSKESIETPDAEEAKENVSVLTFTSQRPQLKADTKTAWDGTSIVWSEGDMIRVGYTLDGAWMGKDAPAPTAAKFYASNPITIDSGDPTHGTFSVPVGSNGFAEQTEGACVFYGIYPYKAIDGTASSAPNLSVTLPTSQTPAANSFDATGDIMVGKTAVFEGFPSEAVNIRWTRLVAHLDLTFKNLSSVEGYTDGEIVSDIKLTASSPITGTFTLDLRDNTVSGASSNEITINGDNLSNNNGNIEAWACVLPVTVTSLNVEITTNKAKYTRNITGISKSFKQNARNTLAVNMATAERETVAAKYILVTDTDELTEDSEVIIVATNYNYAMNTSGNNNRGQQSVTKITENGVSYIESPSAAVQVFYLKAGSADYSIAFQCKNSRTGYIYASSNSQNRLGTQSTNNDNGSFSVEITTEGVATLKAQGSNTRNWIRYNQGSGLFSCYLSGQEDVSLYKLFGSGNGKNLLPKVPHIKVTSDNPLSVDCTAGSQIITYNLVNVESGSVTASKDVDWITNLNVTAGHVSFDFDANDPDGPSRTGHITLSYSGAESVVVTVKQAPGENSGYKYVYTSNVASSLSGTSSFGVVIDGEQYDAYCGGSRQNAGSISFVVPAGTTKVYFHAVRYGTDTAPTVTITASVGSVDAVTPSLNNMRTCSTIGGANTQPYTVTTDPDTDFFVLTVSDITAESTITLTNNQGLRRFVVWGVNAVAE